MAFVPVMWTIWGALVVVTFALFVYRTKLTRDEENQIFLDDCFEQERAAQEAIVAKVNKIEPALRVSSWIVAAATLFVIVYYILDIINKLR
jgi:anaerobic C4-dicarboxylate transporter